MTFLGVSNEKVYDANSNKTFLLELDSRYFSLVKKKTNLVESI